MLLREIIGICCENHMEFTNIVYFFIFKFVMRVVTTEL
jgi:hypothetical protein